MAVTVVLASMVLAQDEAEVTTGESGVFLNIKDATFTEIEDDFEQWEDLLPNINMVGTSYDLLRGNPHATSGGIDPGWRLELFETNYDDGNNVFVGTQLYRVPDGVQVASCPVCSLQMQSSEAGSAEDYAKSLSVSVRVRARKRGLFVRGSFKASADFQSVQQKSEQSNNFFMESTAECAFYCPRIRMFDPPKLSKAFATAVEKLPANYTDANVDQWDQFIDLFGTHFALGVTMGGKYGVRHEISQSALQSLKLQGINVKASASFSAMGFSGGGSLLTDSQKKSAKAFSSRTETQTSFSYGGRPVANPNDPADTSLWMDNARADPVPINYDMLELTELFDPAVFPSDVAIDDKRVALEDALTGYCARLETQGEIVCDPAVVSNPPAFKIEKAGPIGDDLPQSFDDFKQWNEMGRPALTEIRGRASATALTSMQAVYGIYAANQHGLAGFDLEPFKLEPGEHITGAEVCYSPTVISRLTFFTSRDRTSDVFGVADVNHVCRTYNFPSRLLYFSGSLSGATPSIRALAFHYASFDNPEDNVSFR